MLVDKKMIISGIRLFVKTSGKYHLKTTMSALDKLTNEMCLGILAFLRRKQLDIMQAANRRLFTLIKSNERRLSVTALEGLLIGEIEGEQMMTDQLNEVTFHWHKARKGPSRNLYNLTETDLEAIESITDEQLAPYKNIPLFSTDSSKVCLSFDCESVDCSFSSGFFDQRFCVAIPNRLAKGNLPFTIFWLQQAGRYDFTTITMEINFNPQFIEFLRSTNLIGNVRLSCCELCIFAPGDFILDTFWSKFAKIHFNAQSYMVESLAYSEELLDILTNGQLKGCSNFRVTGSLTHCPPSFAIDLEKHIEMTANPEKVIKSMFLVFDSESVVAQKKKALAKGVSRRVDEWDIAWDLEYDLPNAHKKDEIFSVHILKKNNFLHKLIIEH